MLNFVHYIPTKVVFGKQTREQAGELAAQTGAKKVMIIHDGSPFLKPLLDGVKASLENSGLVCFEFDEVRPDPKVSMVRRGIALCREEKGDFLLAVGGGSTIDTAKAIAMGVPYDADVWDFYKGKVTDNVLPIGVILTIPATGSECDSGSVVTNDEGMLKRCANFPALFPKFAIMDPELTYSLPPKQTAAGLADMYVHVMERYFSNTPNTWVIDSMCEGVFRTLKEISPRIMADPKNYDLRSESMWIASIAQNETLGVGREQDWGTHYLGHEVTAMYGITHGVTMAVLSIAWMKYVHKHDPARFVRYAKYGLEIDVSGKDAEQVALEAIDETRALFAGMGLPMSLKELGVKKEDFEALADKALHENAFLGGDYLGAFVKLHKEDLINILELAY